MTDQDMENNEKQNPAENGAPRQGGKKPYHKHHHRHRPGPRQGDKVAADQANTAGAPDIAEVNGANSEHQQESRPRHHRNDRNHGHRPHRNQQRAEVQQEGEQSVSAEAEDSPREQSAESERRHENHHKRHRNDRRRGERHQSSVQTAEEAPTEIVEEVSEAEETAVISEYVTTAGSLDAEVIDELNSVSAAEAENLDISASDVEETFVTDDNVPLETYTIAGIRFKVGGKIYYFDPGDFILSKGDAVVVETSRGLEYGICEIPNKTVTEREVVLPLRSVVKLATPEDTARHESNLVKEKEAFVICSQKILDHNLGMKLIDVEYAFDGSKLLFYFTADGRVDFRELVKDLAAVFRTRIELRQIGIRDETKLLGGIGICGRPFCCKTFLSDFVQVSIKMAKEQNLSLNSVKISGACGRLMCCLRYEYDVYQEEIKKTPRVDQIVSTPDGDGTVIEVQPLAGLVRVRFGTKADMITPKVYHRDEVTVIGGKGVKPKEAPAQ